MRAGVTDIVNITDPKSVPRILPSPTCRDRLTIPMLSASIVWPTAMTLWQSDGSATAKRRHSDGTAMVRRGRRHGAPIFRASPKLRNRRTFVAKCPAHEPIGGH